MSYYNNTVYGPQPGTRSFLYGYDFALDSTKTISYIQLNNNPNMAIFAIDLVNTQAQQQIAMAPTSGPIALGSASPSSVQGNTNGSGTVADVESPVFTSSADPAYRCFAWTTTFPAGGAWASPANGGRDEGVAPTVRTIRVPLPAQSFGALATDQDQDGMHGSALRRRYEIRHE